MCVRPASGSGRPRGRLCTGARPRDGTGWAGGAEGAGGEDGLLVQEGERTLQPWRTRGAGESGARGGTRAPGAAMPEREGISEEGRWGSVWGEMGHVQFGHHCPPLPR